MWSLPSTPYSLTLLVSSPALLPVVGKSKREFRPMSWSQRGSSTEVCTASPLASLLGTPLFMIHQPKLHCWEKNHPDLQQIFWEWRVTLPEGPPSLPSVWVHPPCPWSSILALAIISWWVPPLSFDFFPPWGKDRNILEPPWEGRPWGPTNQSPGILDC